MMGKSAVELVQAAQAQLEGVSPKDAAREIAAGDAVVLDVREAEEWDHHIEGAVQVPRGLLESAADPASPRHKPELDPARRVIVYCRSGARSALAGVTLETMGYENVANLEGGFNAWKEAGLPAAEHNADL